MLEKPCRKWEKKWLRVKVSVVIGDSLCYFRLFFTILHNPRDRKGSFWKLKKLWRGHVLESQTTLFPRH